MTFIKEIFLLEDLFGKFEENTLFDDAQDRAVEPLWKISILMLSEARNSEANNVAENIKSIKRI